jgi:nicotinamide mononucleotide transporter
MAAVDIAALLQVAEPLAVLTGIVGVALTVREHIVSWPVGIVSSALFLALFAGAGLYADTLLQGVYVVLGLYGWWHWLRGGPRRNDLPVGSASWRLRGVLAIAAISGTLALGAFLDSATDSSVPYPDAATTVLSLVAQVLLTRKLIESWPVWIVGVNAPYIVLYLSKGLAITAALQLVFIALSVAGWISWRRSMAARATADAGSAAAPAPALALG